MNAINDSINGVATTVNGVKALPSFINEAQATCLKFYDGGDHEYLLSMDSETKFKEALDDCGDGLLRFLIVELSASEDCESTDEAIDRLSRAIEDIEAVRRNLGELTQQ